MLLIATEQIVCGGREYLAGARLEVDEAIGNHLVERRLARCGLPPRVLYETKVVRPQYSELRAEQPLVTCLCLTRNRREWLPKAIACYQAQTYRNRELLIIADGDDVRDLIPNDPSIRLLHIDKVLEVGAKRNYGCERANGELIAVWDDDDYSGPGRLADQVPRLLNSGKAVLKYTEMRFTDGERWWQFVGAPESTLGTSLCFRREYWMKNRFPDKQVGEDHEFAGNAMRAGQLEFAGDAGDLMTATIHPQNTSPRTLTGPQWKAL